MNSNTATVCILTAVFLALGVSSYLDSIEEQRAVEAGLQQCQAHFYSRVLWQKECK
jgi:hypothetical protein